MPNCLKRIKWYESGCRNSNVLQIYKKGLEFSFLSDNLEQCHSFILCKDFLQDIIYSTINNKPINIFNFSYDPNKDPKASLKSLKLLVRNNNDKVFQNKLENSISFINQIEKKLKIKKSKFQVCENKTFLITGSKRWINAPPMISLFILLLRIGLVHKPTKTAIKTLNDLIHHRIKPYQKKDAYLLKHSYLGFAKIVKYGDRKIFYRDMKLNYSATLSVDCIHNATGILSYTHEIANKNDGLTVAIPKWHSI